MCLEKYEIQPACFLTAPEIAWQVALRQMKVKLDLLTYTIMLLMIEQSIKGGICHAIH